MSPSFGKINHYKRDVRGDILLMLDRTPNNMDKIIEVINKFEAASEAKLISTNL